MKPALTDEDLILFYLPTQPTQCYEAIYTRYTTKIYSHCLGVTQNADRAQDFTHDIFLKVFQKLDAFESRARFSTWLYAIAHNYCLDQLRRDKRLPTSALNEKLISWVADEDDLGHPEQSMQVVHQAMETLPPDERAIFQLKYEQKMSLKAIADQYGLTIGAVKMRLKRSRQKIQQFSAEQQARAPLNPYL